MVGESPPTPLVYKKPKKLPIAYTRPATETISEILKIAVVCASHESVLVFKSVGTNTLVTIITVSTSPIIPPITEAITISCSYFYLNICVVNLYLYIFIFLLIVKYIKQMHYVNTMLIQPITLKIDDKDWKEFCSNIPYTRTKNGSVVELIKKDNERQRVKK